MNRTYPKAVGYEQMSDSRPWYTKTGRLEFYRDEDEFIEAGENLPVHREPIDSTFYEPNVIVAPPHEAIRPAGPEDYGVRRDDLSGETRQGRNVVRTWARAEELAAPAASRRLPLRLPHAQVPPRRPHHADRHRHDRHAVRAVRRHLPPRQAHALRRRGLRRHQPGGRQGARRRGRRLRLDRLRPRGPALPRLAEEAEGLRVRRACSAAPATTRARRGASPACGSTCTAPRPARSRATRRGPTAWRRTRAPATRRCSAPARTSRRRAAGSSRPG